ncbi:hypothetical protein DH2020_038650 [Rehmannia glutinosa]|uniref:Uncharacterized protein n=1 Tax=Rehmannia glutinosa TaxID=99300 RepID=A0ABR0UZB2_REHGL
MATSAFKSTTKRASIGGSSSEDSSRRSLRRSRSLSRFSRPIAPEPETETDYNKNVPRGSSGSTTPFPEISLDDLALEFFSSSSKNENESDGVVVERKGREGRSASRHGEIGRWASDTASSRRRGRSVSKTRGNVVSSSSASGGKNVISSDAGSRRRRSLSVARYQISDSESQSSALTDEESKDTHFGKNGFEKIIRAVYAQKAEHPTEDVANGGLYEVMRKELRSAVQEIRTELNQAMGRNQALASGDCLQSENSEALQDFPKIREKYATKLVQVEKHKQDLLSEMLLEEQRGQEVLKMVKELPNSRTLAVAEKPSRARKKSSARSGMSKELIDEAERCFEDFLSNIEDTDISSFDGERSDGSSTLGWKMKERDAAIRETETYKTRAEFTSVEMDGVILPWLQWETSHDSPVTPKAPQRNSEKV